MWNSLKNNFIKMILFLSVTINLVNLPQPVDMH